MSRLDRQPAQPGGALYEPLKIFDRLIGYQDQQPDLAQQEGAPDSDVVQQHQAEPRDVEEEDDTPVTKKEFLKRLNKVLVVHVRFLRRLEKASKLDQQLIAVLEFIVNVAESTENLQPNQKEILHNLGEKILSYWFNASANVTEDSQDESMEGPIASGNADPQRNVLSPSLLKLQYELNALYVQKAENAVQDEEPKDKKDSDSDTTRLPPQPLGVNQALKDITYNDQNLRDVLKNVLEKIEKQRHYDETNNYQVIAQYLGKLEDIGDDLVGERRPSAIALSAKAQILFKDVVDDLAYFNEMYVFGLADSLAKHERGKIVEFLAEKVDEISETENYFAADKPTTEQRKQLLQYLCFNLSLDLPKKYMPAAPIGKGQLKNIPEKFQGSNRNPVEQLQRYALYIKNQRLPTERKDSEQFSKKLFPGFPENQDYAWSLIQQLHAVFRDIENSTNSQLETEQFFYLEQLWQQHVAPALIAYRTREADQPADEGHAPLDDPAAPQEAHLVHAPASDETIKSAFTRYASALLSGANDDLVDRELVAFRNATQGLHFAQGTPNPLESIRFGVIKSDLNHVKSLLDINRKAANARKTALQQKINQLAKHHHVSLQIKATPAVKYKLVNQLTSSSPQISAEYFPAEDQGQAPSQLSPELVHEFERNTYIFLVTEDNRKACVYKDHYARVHKVNMDAVDGLADSFLNLAEGAPAQDAQATYAAITDKNSEEYKRRKHLLRKAHDKNIISVSDGSYFRPARSFRAYHKTKQATVKEKNRDAARFEHQTESTSRTSSKFLGFGEGTVAAVGMYMFASLIFGPIVAISLAAMVFIFGYAANYYLVLDDTKYVLENLFGKANALDEEGKLVSISKLFIDEEGKKVSKKMKAAMITVVVGCIGSGFVYGALSGVSMFSNVLLPLFTKAALHFGVAKIAATVLAASIAVFPAGLTMIGMAAIFYVVAADFIKNKRWNDIAKWVKSLKPEHWNELIPQEKAKAIGVVALRIGLVLVGLFLNVIITVASFGVMHSKGLAMLRLFADAGKSASPIAYIMASLNQVLSTTFAVQKILSLFNTITWNSVINFAITLPLRIVHFAVALPFVVIGTFARSAIKYIAKKFNYELNMSSVQKGLPTIKGHKVGQAIVLWAVFAPVMIIANIVRARANAKIRAYNAKLDQGDDTSPKAEWKSINSFSGIYSAAKRWVRSFSRDSNAQLRSISEHREEITAEAPKAEQPAANAGKGEADADVKDIFSENLPGVLLLPEDLPGEGSNPVHSKLCIKQFRDIEAEHSQDRQTTKDLLSQAPPAPAPKSPEAVYKKQPLALPSSNTQALPQFKPFDVQVDLAQIKYYMSNLAIKQQAPQENRLQQEKSAQNELMLQFLTMAVIGNGVGQMLLFAEDGSKLVTQVLGLNPKLATYNTAIAEFQFSAGPNFIAAGKTVEGKAAFTLWSIVAKLLGAKTIQVIEGIKAQAQGQKDKTGIKFINRANLQPEEGQDHDARDPDEPRPDKSAGKQDADTEEPVKPHLIIKEDLAELDVLINSAKEQYRHSPKLFSPQQRKLLAVVNALAEEAKNSSQPQSSQACKPPSPSDCSREVFQHEALPAPRTIATH